MIKGLEGVGDVVGMMKRVSEVKTKVDEVKQRLKTITVVGEAGAGMVKATANARGEVTGIEIDPSIFTSENREVAEDLILAAVKDAQARAEERSVQEYEKMTETFGLPPGIPLPT